MSEIEKTLAEVAIQHQRIPTFEPGDGYRCSGCAHLGGESDGPNSPRHAAHLAAEQAKALEPILRAESRDVTRTVATMSYHDGVQRGLAALVPAKPSREDVAAAIWEQYPSHCSGITFRAACDACRDTPLRQADAVLALLPGRSVADAKAEALREAVKAIDHGQCDWINNPHTEWDRGFKAARMNDVAELNTRANRIARGDA